MKAVGLHINDACVLFLFFCFLISDACVLETKDPVGTSFLAGNEAGNYADSSMKSVDTYVLY